MRAHRFWSLVIAAAVAYGAYQGYGALTATPAVTSYLTATAATSTVVATLTETGQTAAAQQITLSPKASAEVIGVYVKPGDHVYAGQVVAALDATTAAQSLRNAELSLQNAELTYQQTVATTTLALNLVVAKNDVTNAQIALQKAHDDAYASVASIYSDLGTVESGLDAVLHNSNVAGRTSQKNIDAYTDLVSTYDDTIGVYKNSAETSYTTAYADYNAGLLAYKATESTLTNDELITLAQAAYTDVQAAVSAVRNAHDFFDRVSTDYTVYNLGTSATLAGFIASTNTYTTTAASDQSAALSDQSSIVSAEQALAQAEDALTKAEGGANTLTVQQAALALQQAKDAVTNAETTLEGYTVTAPFSGTIGSVGVQRYDQAGSGTAVATLVTDQETANITVNEVDASKIKVGQKATLTFDALPGVSIAGTVASIDSVGTVSQGVVSYDAVIAFDTPNASVLPGMSVTADIIVGTETGLAVPSNAIKVSGTENYVEVFSPPLAASGGTLGTPSATPPTRVTVTTGLTDDTSTIIESGLTLGEQVVTQTVAGTSAGASTAAPSILNAAGGRSGAMRAGGGAAVFRAGGG